MPGICSYAESNYLPLNKGGRRRGRLPSLKSELLGRVVKVSASSAEDDAMQTSELPYNLYQANVHVGAT